MEFWKLLSGHISFDRLYFKEYIQIKRLYVLLFFMTTTKKLWWVSEVLHIHIFIYLLVNDDCLAWNSGNNAPNWCRNNSLLDGLCKKNVEKMLTIMYPGKTANIHFISFSTWYILFFSFLITFFDGILIKRFLIGYNFYPIDIHFTVVCLVYDQKATWVVHKGF